MNKLLLVLIFTISIARAAELKTVMSPSHYALHLMFQDESEANLARGISEESFALRIIYECAFDKRLREITDIDDAIEDVCSFKMNYVNSFEELSNAQIRAEIQRAIYNANDQVDKSKARLSFDNIYGDALKTRVQ